MEKQKTLEKYSNGEVNQIQKKFEENVVSSLNIDENPFLLILKENESTKMILDIRYDFQRSERIGLVEAIWGEDKSIDQLKRVTKIGFE